MLGSSAVITEAPLSSVNVGAPNGSEESMGHM